MWTLPEQIPMNRSLPRSILLAAAVGCSSLALAATAAQTSPPATPMSSGSMQKGDRHPMHHRHERHGEMRMLDKLGLSATQRADIRRMMQESFEQARPEMQVLRQKREAWEAATPGSSAYQRAADELAAAEANAARQRVVRQAALRARIHGVLTAQQRTRLASLRAQHRERMQQWRRGHPRHSSDVPASADSSG